MTPWFKNVNPHKDIQEGHLDESIFAANLAEVASGTGREIYTNPEMFFRKTYFTAALKNIAKRVIHGLNGGPEAENRVISLQTGFGGGKTHTLISLYHLAKWGTKVANNKYTNEFLSFTGTPKFHTAQIAVFTNTTNDPVQGREIDGIKIRTIWGELAYQLGGKEAYEIIRENDEQRTAPKGLFKKVLEQCKPALLLIDELADYCISASAIKVEASNLSDQTVSFLQELTDAISRTDQCVLIATLPASAQELAASPVSAQILSALENRITRVGANMRPVEDEEIYEVVRRRLFEDLGDDEKIEDVISEYSSMYQSLFTELPNYAVKTDYKDKLRKSYPFHPELIDMFRLRWASNPYFQRTRGVLRILASIVSDLWKRQNSLTGSHFLIHTSDVMLSNVDAITSQITILNNSAWDSVVGADVSGTSSNAFRIDNEIKTFGDYNLTQGVAATILLGTFGSTGQNKGISINELKLCLVKPESFNHNDINGAIDRLEANAHYLYYNTSDQKRFWFDTTPNVNILINHAKGNIKPNEIMTEILNRIYEKSKSIQTFNVLVNPSEDIPEQLNPTLAILSPFYVANPNEVSGNTKNIIERIATKKGNSERIYRNTMLFLICSEIGIGKLQDDIKYYLACRKINEEYNTQLSPDQKTDIRKRIEESGKQSDYSLVSAYSILAKHSAKNGITRLIVKLFTDNMESQINSNIISVLKQEEWLLESVGLNTLKSNNLFPTIDHPVRAKEIYEAFLRFDDKPMITGKDAISKSLQKYCYNGEYCIATGDGKNFSKFFLQENIPYFEVTDETYWLVDKSLKPIPQPAKDDYSNSITDHSQPASTINDPGISDAGHLDIDSIDVKELKSISISGKVPVLRYTELFNYFITPFTQNGYKVEIEMKFKIKSSEANPLNETKPQYKSAKEAAKQLGLNFEED